MDVQTFRSLKCITGIQWDGNNADEIITFCNERNRGWSPVRIVRHHVTDDQRLLLSIASDLSGDYRPTFILHIGYWVTRDENNQIGIGLIDRFSREWEPVTS